MFNILIILTVIILFGFQNCYYPKNKVDLNSGKSGLADSYLVLNQLNGNQIDSITFLTKEENFVQQNSKSFSMLSQNSYLINFKTGLILKNIQITSTQERYCLTQQIHTDLFQILNNLQICKIENVIPENQVCAQVYNSGYVQIKTIDQIYDLGSYSNSCRNSKIDLCDLAAKDRLMQWFEYVKSNLNQLNCPI